MYIKHETEYQNHPVIISIIEDAPGGGTLATSDLVSTDEMKPGALICKDNDNLRHIFKTALVAEAAEATATEYKVAKGHEFKVGDVITKSTLKSAAQSITAINTSAEDFDVLTVGTTIGALAKDDLIIQAKADATANKAEVLYPLEGVSMTNVDLSVDNQDVGILVRGSVNKALMPQSVNADIEAMLPLIRFV